MTAGCRVTGRPSAPTCCWISTTASRPACRAAPPGRHRIEFRYEPGPLKPLLAFAGVLTVTLLGLFGPRLAPAFVTVRQWRIPHGSRVAAGLIALSLPVIVPLFSSGVLAGHD